ncbi:hypothetical protein Tco_0735366 [Tanacetum coccineum]
MYRPQRASPPPSQSSPIPPFNLDDDNFEPLWASASQPFQPYSEENTSQGNSDLAHIGVNLNDEAADSEDVEAQEVPAPMGRDRAKKKGSSFSARSETSIAGDPSLVDALLNKFTMAATPFFTQMKESSSEYLRIKERELELEERKRQEQGELERLRIAQREKELDLQQKMFEFQQQQKFEEGIRKFLIKYEEEFFTVPGDGVGIKLDGIASPAM